MEICAACGIIAPTHRTSCDACEAVFPSPRKQIDARDDDAYWVAVRCQLRCRACGFPTPLNELDADGSVTCAKCGIDQAFAVEEWAPLFQHAHEVGDLAGPNPSGRKPGADVDIAEDNPFKSTGVKHGAASSGEYGGRTVASASPGHPLCARCKAPLQMPLDAVAHKNCRATATCPECKEATTYDLPKNARATYPALRMVLADGNRADQKHVVFQAGSTGQAVVVRCPNCTADLPPLEPKAHHVTCAYCKVTSFIPARAWARLGAEAPPVEAWWLLFRGPSPRRTALEERARKKLHDAARARDEKEKSAARQKAKAEDREREAHEAGERARRDEEETRERQDREREVHDAQERSESLTTAFFVVIIIAVFVGGGVYTWFKLQQVEQQFGDKDHPKPLVSVVKPAPSIAPASSAKGHATHGAGR